MPCALRTPSREIIPQAVSVRYGLAIGAACAPLVQALMWVLSPVAYPIAKLLDLALGVHETHTYKKRELKSFLGFHVTGKEPLKEQEVRILGGVLELDTKGIGQIMTKIEDVFTLSADAVLDQAVLRAISESGYSRIPVHLSGNPNAFVGSLLVKQLLCLERSQLENMPVSSLPLSILPEARPETSCWQALNYFQTGRAHLLLISHTPGRPGGAIGIVTLEDVIEEILSQEIVDETDVYEDNVSRPRRLVRRGPNRSLMRGTIVEYNQKPPLSSTSTMVASPSTAPSTPTLMWEVDDEDVLGLAGGHLKAKLAQATHVADSESVSLGRETDRDEVESGHGEQTPLLLGKLNDKRMKDYQATDSN
ncbi:hypothetical protein D9758_003598 [Tetrapyrgos nigripes]|uniref:CNNM transmembrane domain-containing protein n=1 Tax=Tetrapyrgos nigripes TaxID=182062 RepID=A0A8H5GV57_9AGAR|nr:hypothetical protein D9758_003598 [Tetrapyrgos nigripes]